MKVSATFCVTLALVGTAFAQTTNDILNFALNTEYLAAEFYSCAASGSPVPDELRGGGPASTGCQKAQLDAGLQSIAEEIAADEIGHVRFLRSALGKAAVPIPKLDIGHAFVSAANAAANKTLSPPFSPYANDLNFLLGSFIFNDVDVTAYTGGADVLGPTQYIKPASQILAVEGYHASAIRDQLYLHRDDSTPYGLTVAQVVKAISDLRDSVDGSSDDDQPILAASGAANLVPDDSNGLVFARTPSQVINIVTLGSGKGGGGFFPNGLNGFFGPSGSS